MNDAPKRIAVFISGGGSNLQALIDATKDGRLRGEIVLVVSSSPTAYGLTRAQDSGVATFVFQSKDFDTKDSAENALLKKLKESQIEYIALAGYMKFLSPKIVSAYKNKIINIHPALLPKYGGKGMYGLNVHQAVIESGDKESGLTIHVVDEIYDHGKVLAQVKVPVKVDDTPETLQKRIQIEEHKHYPIVLDKFIKGEYELN